MRSIAGIGHIVVDSFDEIERLERLAPGQKVMLRVTPGIRPDTHAKIQTGQEDSKFGFGIDDVPRAIDAIRTLELCGLHAHIGSQVFDLEPFERLAEVLSGMGDYPLLNLGGGLAIAYTDEDEPPSIESYVETLLAGAPEGVTVLCEPGRSLVGNAGVTLYTVGTVKRIPGVRTYVAVDGGMSDNLRPMLYGARYEAEIADRFGGDSRLHDRRHALRVGRHPRCATPCSTIRARATCWSCPPPAPTATPWRTTTTRSRARRWSSARAATPAWWCAARPTRT